MERKKHKKYKFRYHNLAGLILIQIASMMVGIGIPWVFKNEFGLMTRSGFNIPVAVLATCIGTIGGVFLSFFSSIGYLRLAEVVRRHKIKMKNKKEN